MIRGADTPDIEAGVAAIRAVLKTLPMRSGVYRMQDARGDVLYVGKARALRNRVANYTQIPQLPKRLQRMVALTRSLTLVTTNTEAEALLLEAQLIKRSDEHTPELKSLQTLSYAVFCLHKKK